MTTNITNNELTTCSLINVLTKPEFADSKYEVDKGSLYLSDGTKRIVRVDLLDESLNRFLRESTLERFLELIDPNTHRAPFSEVVWSQIKTQFKNNSNSFRNKNDIEAYIRSYGLNTIVFDEKKLSEFLEQSENLYDVKQLCVGLLSSDKIRKIVAEMLNHQEASILEKMPKEFFNDPDTLRHHLTELLEEKGLSYEEAVAQFNWSKGEPQKAAVEGSYVLAKLIAQVDAWKAIWSKKGGEHFPFQDVWRFSIDGSREKDGAYIFENEPFYILSTLRGLEKILNSQKQLSLQTYESYALALMQNPPILKHSFNYMIDPLDSVNGINTFFMCKAHNGSQSFDASVWKHDAIGSADLNQRSTNRQQAEESLKLSNTEFSDRDYWLANATGFRKSGNYIGAVANTTSALIFERIFLGLEQILKKAQTPGERLMGYIWAARELDVTHQLEDGNGRTSIHFLIKCIADDPDLPLYIPEDPNILDQQGPEALLRDIHSGMVRFKVLSGGKPDEVINVETLIDQAGIRGVSWDVVHVRAELPTKLISKLVAEDKEAVKNIN